jgi:hypothetical protein
LNSKLTRKGVELSRETVGCRRLEDKSPSRSSRIWHPTRTVTHLFNRRIAYPCTLAHRQTTLVSDRNNDHRTTCTSR